MSLFTRWRTQRCKSKCCPVPSTPITTHNYCRAHYLSLRIETITHSTQSMKRQRIPSREVVVRGASDPDSRRRTLEAATPIILFSSQLILLAHPTSQPRHDEMETFNPFRFTENFIIARHPQKKAADVQGKAGKMARKCNCNNNGVLSISPPLQFIY